MICCDEYYNLGCYSNCSDITMPAEIEVEGDYVINYKINNSNALHQLTVTGAEIGDEIKLPIEITQGSITFYITFSDGSVLNIGDVQCFKVTITPTFQTTALYELPN